MPEFPAAEETEALAFDVELERVPPMVYGISAATIVASLLAAVHVVPMIALVPILLASSLGRRFPSSGLHLVAAPDRVELGRRVVPAVELRDVWVDADEVEPRVVLTIGDALEVVALRFRERQEALRFAEIYRGHDATPVVGNVPRPRDALPSLRFVAIAIAFYATGSPWSVLVLVFFFLGAVSLVRAKQLVLGTDGFEVRSAFGISNYRFSDVKSIDLDVGTIDLDGDRELAFTNAALRGPTMASTAWIERARTRALTVVRERARHRS